MKDKFLEKTCNLFWAELTSQTKWVMLDMDNDNSILQIIFETREDELANINMNDKLFLEQNGRESKRVH